MTQDITTTRKIINDIDKHMAQLFEQRMEAAREVALYKMENGLPILDSSREEEVITNNLSYINDEQIKGYYRNFIINTMDISKKYQKQLTSGMRVAYSGVEGAYAHIASELVFPGTEKVGYQNFQDAYEAVVNAECDSVVLPVENSSAGEVGQVTDLLFSGPLYVNDMIDIEVKHNLMAKKGTKLEDIKTVVSHQQALSQCAGYIKKHGFEEKEFVNTALAAEYVAGLEDGTIAAIASDDSAARFGLEILASGINDSGVNSTRFAILSRSEIKDNTAKHGAHFILMFTVKNEAGSLARALNIIGSHGYNLRTLRSRPMKDLLWEYCFYAEAEGNINKYDGRAMMEELKLCCDKLKVVGSYIRK